MTAFAETTPQPTPRLRPPGYELSRLELQHVTELAVRLRRATRGARTLERVAEALVDVLFHGLSHDDAPPLALVRVYLTRPLGELSPELQEEARRSYPRDALGDDVRCLTLAASRGHDPDWNDVKKSRGHRVIPLPSADAVEKLPMVLQLVRQLGLEVSVVVAPSRELITDSSQTAFNAFHVAEAPGSPHIPAQDFVTKHGIASAFGFGGVLPTGQVFVAVAFSTLPVDAATARLFELFALYSKLCFLDADEVTQTVAPSLGLTVKSVVLEQLLLQHEAKVEEWGHDWSQALAASRADFERLAAARERELKQHNEQLREAQVAMLQMIEDLRQARSGLEDRVAERTRELSTANQQLQERNQELEEFAYIASHDLQEPLRTVSGYLQILERRYKGKLDSDADEFIAFAVDGAKRMQALIESLLVYSRVTTHAQPMRVLKLDQALDGALENLAYAIADSSAKIERDPLPEVVADPVQLIQLFQNLVGNAIKFAGPEGPRIHIGAELEGDRWRVSVRDEGVGFNPKYTDRIFKIFKRLSRNKPGTGIGLAICKKIVQRHGGEIGAHSEPGKGATFFFSLPRAEPAA